MYDYLDDRQTKRLKELVPYKILAPDADEIIEELDRLNNIINEAKEYIKEWQRFPHTNGSTHKELENLMKILDKELKENNNE